MRANLVKQRLAAGETVVGTMVFEFASTGIGRLAANAGADFIIYDMEHSGWSIDTMRMLMATTATPFVRVPASDYHLIAPVLDVGAVGVMVPMVESRAQAEPIARAAKYPPVGRRGSGFGLAHDDYTGGDIAEKMRLANDNVLVIAMIETEAGVAAAEEIMAVEGIDLIWVGQFDLSASLGIPAQFDHPRFIAAMDRIVDCAQARSLPLGVLAMTVDEGKRWFERGFRAFCYGMDTIVYRQALETGISGMKSLGGTA